MKSNLPNSAPSLPNLKPEEALKQPGFYFVTSTVVPEVGVAGTDIKAVPV